MGKKTGPVLVAMGAALTLAALLLLASNWRTSARAGQISAQVVEHLTEMVESPPPTDDIPQPTEATLDPELPVVTIDGHDYVGYLEFADLELKLPVLAQWSSEGLQIAPCREFGSSRTDDLVIAAHNYSTHFGRLKTLKIGAKVTFTDMDGIENVYTVAETFTLDPTNSAVVYDSDYPLVLYTCTPGGETRQVLMCQRAEE